MQTGAVIREISGDKTPGIHVVQWDLRRAGGGGGGGQAALGVGSYGVKITAGATVESTVLQVKP